MQSLPCYRKKINLLFAKALALFACSGYFTASCQQPFRFDNIAYKAIYWNDAVRLMNSNRDYLLLDVRTPGEFADTARYSHMNMGHIRGAVNISIDSVPEHLQELRQYGDKNIFVYCSHSQRSRRVSKLLADNGFKNVYNINGGMSVANESGPTVFPLKTSVLVNGNPYTNIASTEALDLIQKGNIAIIDIRSRNEFSSTDPVYHKNLGRIKSAVNIPANEFNSPFSALNIPKTKTVLLYDLDGGSSPDIAAALSKMGYTHVYNLFEGLEALMCDNYLTPAAVQKIIVNPAPFHVVSVKECIRLLSKSRNFLIIDARPKEEFDNKSPHEHLNNGRLKNAVNVPSTAALAAVTEKTGKGTNILVYGSYSGNNDVDICKALNDQGYKNVYFLYQGIGRFSWACFNIENCKDGIVLLTEHTGLY